MYYLNAFNEMLRKRQRQNMMGGEGVGNAPPSGPMGARQSNGMAGVRNFLNDPLVNIFAAVTPLRAPFAAAKLGVSVYDKLQANQNPYADDSMDRLSFNAPAYGPVTPDFSPYPDFSVDPSAHEGAMSTNSFPAERMGGTVPDDSMERLSAPSTPSIVSDPMSRPFLGGVALTPMATDTIGQHVNFGSLRGEGRLQSGGFGQTGLYGDAGAGMGTFGDAAVGAGGGFGGNVGTGNFGGSPADAANLGYNQGGMVTPERLMGRAPAPDDGYGALQGGEYVITKAAVEKYGKRLLDAINNGTFR